MDRLNQFSFYHLGKIIKEFELIKDKEPITTHDVFMPLVSARGAIKNLLDGDPIPLGISRISAEELFKTIDKL